MKWLMGLGAIWMLVVIAVGLIGAVAWVHGIILAFSASVVLGIVCIFLEVPFVIFGLVYWFTGNDLAQQIVEYFSR